MRLATGLAAIALLAGTASAKLSVQRVERHESAAGAVAVERRVANGSAPATPAAPNENSIFKKGSFTKIPQNETTCATRGEKQWAGTVDISDDKRLFYWWFDSRHDAENDPIVIFLNGGPGASSMNGLFGELGPCYLPANQTNSAPNPYSWNNNASLLFIDQPAGVGFSQLKDGTPNVQGDEAAAQDLQTFLRLFFDNVFPAKAKLPIHFTGESYGGHYVPMTMKAILEAREERAENAFWGNITSLIFINPVFHELQIVYGDYQVMCTGYRGHNGPRWNETVCTKIAELMPSIELVSLSCDLSYDGKTCSYIDDAMGYFFDVLYEPVNGKLIDSHNADLECFSPPYCDRPNLGNITAYLHQPAVLQALGFSSEWDWQIANGEASNAFRENFSAYKPTTRELAAVLDAGRGTFPLQKDPIRVLVLNGNLDLTCATPGQQWVFDQQVRWSGSVGYRAAEWRDWKDLGLGVGEGLWKSSENHQLLFLGVDGAGHMVPLDKPEVADAIVRKWVTGWAP